ncbi:MAG: hypothetical protein CMC81_06035 [Flavobacteriaceae bacterium]|nr:hypothetical protein [Flavobacteriaceae bacterium]
MKKIKLLLIITFLIGCSRTQDSINDFEILKKLYENTLRNEYLIDSIITYKGPSNFKNISIDFDVYQVIYKQKNGNKGSKFYTLTKNEIFRLGKGLNCVIISNEKRWKKTGERITSLKSWIINNQEENFIDKPINNLKSLSHNSDKDDLPENLKKVICN